MPMLVLIRHGQSAWNLENRFTGWWDVDVTEKGVTEARAAGALMRDKGLDFDCTFTSLQTRAIKTLNLALEEMGRLWLPVEKDWRLNERHYGGLTGLDKAETAAKHGADQVKIWRRSFDVPPPPLEPGSPYDLSSDRRYAGINVPSTESLKDTIARDDAQTKAFEPEWRRKRGRSSRSCAIAICRWWPGIASWKARTSAS